MTLRYHDANGLVHRMLSRPRFSYLEIWIRPSLWILGYSADLEVLRDDVYSGGRHGPKDSGPRVVLKSQVPCAVNVDKAGEHVVHSRAMTRMADKIFVC